MKKHLLILCIAFLSVTNVLANGRLKYATIGSNSIKLICSVYTNGDIEVSWKEQSGPRSLDWGNLNTLFFNKGRKGNNVKIC